MNLEVLCVVPTIYDFHPPNTKLFTVKLLSFGFLDFKNALHPIVLIKHALKSQVENLNLAPYPGKQGAPVQDLPWPIAFILYASSD